MYAKALHNISTLNYRELVVMREIIYKYDNRGLYQTDDNTSFAGDSHIKIIVEPHDFSIAIGGEVLRSTSYDGGMVIVSCEGEVVFCDNEDNIIGRADKSEDCYAEVRLEWKQDFLSIQFGRIDTVDYYPNCDGEYDRWGKEWVTQRSVTLNLKNNSVEAE